MPTPAYASTTSAAKQKDRPTKADITNLVNWVGGSLNSLPYSPLTTSVSTNDDSPITAASVGGFWGRFWFEVVRDVKYHRQQFKDEIAGDGITQFPLNFPLRIPPTCSSKVNAAVDQVNVGDPQVKVHLPEGFRDSEKRSGIERKIAKFCTGILQQEERDSDTSPLRDQVVNTIAYGLGARHVVLNIADWPDRPKKRRYESKPHFQERLDEYNKARRRCNPFVIRSVHPLNICYDRANTKPKWVILREPMNPWDLAKQFPNWQSDSGNNRPGITTQYVVFTQYWTDDFYACYANNQALLGPDDGADADGVAPNPYGFIPVWPSAGGSGEQDPFNRPEYELAGIIRKNRDVLLADASVFNQEEVWRQRSMLGPKMTVTGPDPIVCDQILQQLMGSPLKGVKLPTGYNFREVPVSPLPPALLDQRQRINADIDRGMVYDVASGAGNPSEPAARTRVRLFQVDKRFAAAVLAIQQCLEASLTAAVYMVRDVLKEPVGVNVAQVGVPAEYIDLSPDEIPDGIVIEVNLIGDSEEEKARKQQMGDARLQNGTLDLFHYLQDYVGEPDPQKIMSGLYVDAIRKAVIIPQTIAAFQGQIPQIVLQAMQAAGMQFTPQDGTALQPDNGGGQPLPPNMMPQPGQPGQPGDPNGGGASVAVGPNGAVLPGEGDNAAIARPNSPEGLAAQLQQGLQMPQLRPLRRGPPVMAPGS